MAAPDLNKVTVEVNIGTKSCDVSTLSLRQTMFGHHHFKIEVNYRAKEQSLWMDNSVEVFDWLGEPINIRIEEASGAVNEFAGVITKVNLGGECGNQGVVELIGGSPTLLMTDDYSMVSFTDFELSTIVYQTLNDFGYKMESRIEPCDRGKIAYVCRYRESSYGFLRRLLSDCGEWFYYDGKKIVVGALNEQGEDVPMFYKRELMRVNMSAKVGNFRVEQYDYDASEDQTRQWFAMPRPNDYYPYLRKAFEKSEAFVKGNTILPSTIPLNYSNTGQMENSVAADHFRKLGGESLFEAQTNSCKASLGSVIKVNLDPEGRQPVIEFGRFRIVDIEHTYDGNKEAYYNTICGISADIKHMAPLDVAHPQAFAEVATVVDNNDPEKQGRVKVQFIWQNLNQHPQDMTSNWMRVQTPDAGSSDNVEKNRGFFFIPEIGDQVMVGYEYGDPNRPFVMGSLFHANNSQGITGENTVKTIRTKSGHTLEFNDDEGGSWGITIKDREGCVMHFDTKGKNIEITAPETMTLNAKNISINAGEVLSTTSGKDTTMQVGENLTQNISENREETIGKSKTENIGEEFRSTIGKNYSLEVDGDIKREGGSIKETSQGAAKYESVDKLTLKSSDEVIIAQ